MRINKFIAQATGLSRRASDQTIADGRVRINNQAPSIGQNVVEGDIVTLDGSRLIAHVPKLTIMLNKPAGYVCSREGQGSKTIYTLLSKELHHLKPVGRLDKNSSGLLLLTNDGELANRLTHPRYQKEKVYEVEIDHPLKDKDLNQITKIGVDIGERTLSRFQLQRLATRGQKLAKPLVPNSFFLVTMTEGRNRQIRRTFEALGYKVTSLRRTRLGKYVLGSLESGRYQRL